MHQTICLIRVATLLALALGSGVGAEEIALSSSCPNRCGAGPLSGELCDSPADCTADVCVGDGVTSTRSCVADSDCDCFCSGGFFAGEACTDSDPLCGGVCLLTGEGGEGTVGCSATAECYDSDSGMRVAQFAASYGYSGPLFVCSTELGLAPPLSGLCLTLSGLGQVIPCNQTVTCTGSAVWTAPFPPHLFTRCDGQGEAVMGGTCGEGEFPCELAEENLLLTAGVVDGEELIESCGTITAKDAFGVAASGDLTLVAGEWVALGNGFSVDGGGQLAAAAGTGPPP